MSAVTSTRSRPTRTPTRPSTRSPCTTPWPSTSPSSSSSPLPAFCQSRQCGPTLDAVKDFAKTEPGITFINVEPYKLQYANGSLQPVFDANGNLQPTDVTNAWGLLSEPWIFVVDKNGIVQGSFSLIFTTDELKAAVAAATK